MAFFVMKITFLQGTYRVALSLFVKHRVPLVKFAARLVTIHLNVSDATHELSHFPLFN